MNENKALLAAGQILALERRSNMTDDEALRFGRSVESAILAKLGALAALPAQCHDLRYHDQYRIGWNRCLDECRAALDGTTMTGNAVCKGAMALGSGCGKCERCKAELASAPADPEAEEVEFLARMLESLGAWRAEDWSELLERRPAILAMLRPMIMEGTPVADERAAVREALKGMQRWFGKWPEFVPADDKLSDAAQAVAAMNEAIKAADTRSALARAPVAKPKCAPIDDGICWSSKEIQRRQKEEDEARAAYYHSRASAPVAGEAQKPVAWANWKVGTDSYVPYRTREEAQACVRRSAIAATQEGPYEVAALYAAPQASEAVRDAIKTFGSKVIKALAAIARANGPDTRKEDDPELLYRDPVMDEVVRIRQAYDELSAALSAQPGAQKEKSDE